MFMFSNREDILKSHVPAPDDPWMLYETALLPSFTRIFPPEEDLKFFSTPTVANEKTSDATFNKHDESLSEKKNCDDNEENGEGDGDEEDDNSDEDQDEKKNSSTKPSVGKKNVNASYEDILVMVRFYFKIHI
jgi:hypothetical protein